MRLAIASRMMKTIALLLIGVQALGFVPPVACAREGHDASVHHHADSASRSAAVDSGSCDACGMPDCPDMATCAASAPALAAHAGVAWATLSRPTVDRPGIRTFLDHCRDPVRPPPRV